LRQRRTFRLAEELREVVARRLEQRARQLTSGERWDDLRRQVTEHSLDPWAAADEMLASVNA
jgi:LAO/AO transport system kinase